MKHAWKGLGYGLVGVLGIWLFGGNVLRYHGLMTGVWPFSASGRGSDWWSVEDWNLAGMTSGDEIEEEQGSDAMEGLKLCLSPTRGGKSVGDWGTQEEVGVGGRQVGAMCGGGESGEMPLPHIQVPRNWGSGRESLGNRP